MEPARLQECMSSECGFEVARLLVVVLAMLKYLDEVIV